MQAGDDAALANDMQPSVYAVARFELCGSLTREPVSAIGSYALQLRGLHCTPTEESSTQGPAWDFSPLMTESSAARLLHLTKLSLPTIWHVTPTESWQLEQAFTTASQQLVAAYSAQLTSLCLRVWGDASVSSWLRLLFSCCDRLDDLTIEWGAFEWIRPVELQLELAEAEELSMLPRLERLTIANLPLTDGGLLSVLRRCPGLETYSMWQMPYVTTAGREAAVHCCPTLNGVCAECFGSSRTWNRKSTTSS